MDRAAALNNDAEKSIYTYAFQLPYLNSALQELQELFELNEVPVTAKRSAVMTVAAGTTEIGFNAASPLPSLPNDLVEPVQLWERLSGVDPYVPMTKIHILPLTMAGVLVSQFINYVWEEQKIKVLESNQDNDIKMNYIAFLFAQFTSPTGNDVISIINSRSFLEYRTAGLIADFMGENKTRADELNSAASLALDRVVGISAKGRQNIMTRRRPFRSGWKRRGVYS